MAYVSAGWMLSSDMLKSPQVLAVIISCGAFKTEDTSYRDAHLRSLSQTLGLLTKHLVAEV